MDKDVPVKVLGAAKRVFIQLFIYKLQYWSEGSNPFPRTIKNANNKIDRHR
jgi:hypothetical protein